MSATANSCHEVVDAVMTLPADRLARQSAIQAGVLGKSTPLIDVVPAARMLSALDKLRLIRILVEDLEDAREIFPFERGKTYDLPTPYDAFGAATVLAEGLVTYGEEFR